MEFGGPETQRLVDHFVKNPKTNQNRVGPYTCVYCRKVAYAKQDRSMCFEMQSLRLQQRMPKGRLEGSQTVCVPTDEEPKALRLTWKQVEAKGGAAFQCLSRRELD